MNDDVGASPAQRFPVDASAQLPAHECGDDPRSQTGHESVRCKACAVIYDVNLELALIPAGLHRYSTVSSVEAVLDGVGDQLGQHGGQRLGGIGVDVPKEPSSLVLT